jgi:hypothetical protein
MRRQPATIICDAARSHALAPVSSQPGDWHDVTGHHRYYGSSATNAVSESWKAVAGRAPAWSISAASERASGSKK